MKAREIMTADPMAVLPSDSIRRAADIMRELNVGAVPVIENARTRMLRGIITDRDIAIRCTTEGHAPTCSVGNHMSRLPLETIGPDEDVHDAMAKMERAQVRRIPVVTSEGVLLGVIAQADLATRVGPKEPREIETYLERVSAPSVIATVAHA